MKVEEEGAGGGEGGGQARSETASEEAGADFYNLWRDIDADRVAVWQAGREAHATWLATC